MGYCHCESCRHWSAGPVNAFILWEPDQVRITKGQEHVLQYSHTENSERKWCAKCGGHLMTGHPGLKLIDVYAAVVQSVEFKPGIHVNYAESVLPMKDGLPKMKDFPTDFGGSGEVVSE
ncbi:MAG: GFA family protein [Pacificibacter sp.]